MSGSKRTSTQPKEWAKHLRPFGKKEFWSSVRNIFRSEEKEEMIQEIDPEELKRNKEEYNRELAICLGGESDTRTPYIVAKRIDDGINEQSVIPEGLISEKMIEALGGVRMSPERMEENLRNMNELSENGVQPLTHFKPISGSNPFLMSCPEPNQINPISPEKANEIFKDIRGRMREPGPQSIDDLLLPPIAVSHPTNSSIQEQIKSNVESAKIFFPETNDKPLPKVVTIEVKGLPNTGKIMLLQLIDKALHEKFGITALCAELEDKENLCDLDNIPQHVMEAYVDRKILIEMNIKEIKEKIPFPSLLQCPCCD